MSPYPATITLEAPPVCRQTILRYAGCRCPNDEISALLNDCLEEALPQLSYRVRYCRLPVAISGERCSVGPFVFSSHDLAANLSGCGECIVFAATVGMALDRLISRSSHIAPARAVMLQAIGTERIEALCDSFCQRFSGRRPRFSPGYGDLPLTAQQDIFSLLNCGREIGIYLSDSLLMSPSKSVTALLGLCGDECTNSADNCARCAKTDCLFRGKP